MRVTCVVSLLLALLVSGTAFARFPSGTYAQNPYLDRQTVIDFSMSMAGRIQSNVIDNFKLAEAGLTSDNHVGVGVIGPVNYISENYTFNFVHQSLQVGGILTKNVASGLVSTDEEQYDSGLELTSFTQYIHASISDNVSIWGVAGSFSGNGALVLDWGGISVGERNRTSIGTKFYAFGITNTLIESHGGFRVMADIRTSQVRTWYCLQGGLIPLASAGNSSAALNISRKFTVANRFAIVPSLSIMYETKTDSGITMSGRVDWLKPNSTMLFGLRSNYGEASSDILLHSSFRW